MKCSTEPDYRTKQHGCAERSRREIRVERFLILKRRSGCLAMPEAKPAERERERKAELCACCEIKLRNLC